jgi:hypothetical protein
MYYNVLGEIVFLYKFSIEINWQDVVLYRPYRQIISISRRMEDVIAE